MKILLTLILCLIPFLSYGTMVTDFTEETTPASTDLLWLTINPSTTAADRKITIGNLFNLDLTMPGAYTFSKVNAAGGSADVLTLSGTLGIMDGSDTFRGIYINYTNSNHTGSGNDVIGIDIGSITGDAEATESGFICRDGWDYCLISYSPVLFGGDGSTTKGNLKLYDLDNSAYVGITPADATTSYTLTLPSAAPTANGLPITTDTDGTSQFATGFSSISIGGGTASTVAAWDGSQVLGSLSSQNVVTTGQIDGRVKVVVVTEDTAITATSSNQAVYYINGANSTRTFTLPSAVAGLAYCFANALYAQSLIVDPATGDQIILAGAAADAGEYVESTSAAATDKICVLAIDTTYWLVTASTGTWAQDTP